MPVILNMNMGSKYGVKSTLGSVQLIFNPPDSQGYFPTRFHVKLLVNLDLKGLRADLTPFPSGLLDAHRESVRVLTPPPDDRLG